MPPLIAAIHSLTPGCDIREHVTFLDARRDQRVELQLRVLTRRTHTRMPEMPHLAILTQKVPIDTRLRQFSLR